MKLMQTVNYYHLQCLMVHINVVFVIVIPEEKKDKELYGFFWVIPRRLNYICRRFGTLCSIFIDR